MDRELWQLSAVTLADMIRQGETSSREVAEAHLGRIDHVNADLNAVVDVRPDEVLAEADRADVAVRAGGPLGSLHGVPFSVKINIDVAGQPTSHGTVALRDRIAPRDGPTVQRMREAGAVVLARTNMPDLGLRINTESSLYGPTHNPWRHGHTAGGSSGGEAAAIAAGMSPMGLGNDIGGSLRNPAFACGITSLKPSRARVPVVGPSDPVEPGIESQLMSAEGVLARHVADVRAGLEAIMGYHPLDAQSVDAPLVGRAAPRRVALVVEPIGGDTDPDVAEGVRVAARALAAAGYEVDEVEPPMLFDAYITWAEMMNMNFVITGDAMVGVIGEGGQRFLDLTATTFPDPTPNSIYEMLQRRNHIARAWREFMATYPLVVGPTWTFPPFAHGYDIIDAVSAMRVIEGARFVLPANLLGLPAVSVPTGVTNGLPTGAQIIGDLFREDLCLDAAEAVERAVGVLTPIDPRR